MERLTGLDASFLYMETPSLHMHVSMAAVFDPSTVPGGYSFEKLRERVASRLDLAPVFRRRLVEVPLRLGHPSWIEDQDLDLDYHLRRGTLPSPGGIEDLARYVAEASSRPLDRSKPLWEMSIVEGLEHGYVGLVSKVHHSAIDGVSGAELLAQLFDLEPGPPARGAPERAPVADTMPSSAHLLAQALASRLAAPLGITRLSWRTGRSMRNVRRIRRAAKDDKGALPLTTPRTSLNAAITARRGVAFASISLDQVKELKTALDVTVNDVILAICTGALRRYLQGRSELPAAPLVAAVPVSVHSSLGDRRGANKFSAMFVSLPCGTDDPKERVETIRSVVKGAKSEYNALGADMLLNWAEYSSPNFFSTAARIYTRLHLADHHRPIQSLLISNFPGPDFPLYLGGAEMVAAFPLGPVLDGAGLNVTVMSYRGVLNWGIIACADTVPGTADIAAAVPESLDELRAAAGLVRSTPAGIAPG